MHLNFCHFLFTSSGNPKRERGTCGRSELLNEVAIECQDCLIKIERASLFVEACSLKIFHSRLSVPRLRVGLPRNGSPRVHPQEVIIVRFQLG